MDRTSKKARIHEEMMQCRVPTVSDSAFAQVMKQIKLHPALLEDCDKSGFRKNLQAGPQRQFDECSVTLRLPLLAGGDMLWRILDLGKLLQLFVAKSAAYGELLQNSMAKHGPIHRLIIVHDEISAGNVLRSDNRRKFSPLYVAFEEYGLALQSEYAWLALGCITHAEAQLIDGGLSNVIRILLRHLFLGENSIASLGIVIPFSQPKLLFVKLSPFLLDEAAVKTTFDCKGAAGIRPCISCKNTVSASSDLVANDPSNYLCDVSEINVSRFDVNSNADIFATVDDLLVQSASLNVGQLEELCKAAGFNINRFGVLFDRDLRPFLPEPLQRWDPLHCLFSHGIASTEMVAFLDAIKRKLKIVRGSL